MRKKRRWSMGQGSYGIVRVDVLLITHHARETVRFRLTSSCIDCEPQSAAWHLLGFTSLSC